MAQAKSLILKFEISEPYRWFFALGILFLLSGALVWIPLLWGKALYPVLLHRVFMVNGFTACFIAGFLMTAVPRFSSTEHANIIEVFSFTFVTLSSIVAGFFHQEQWAACMSGIQALILLTFILRRMFHRKQNPPYSFLFIFVGLILWSVSAFHFALTGSPVLKVLHYEGAIASIILGVGSRLIPGILGHVEIVQKQRAKYEKPVSLWETIPFSFFLLIMSFVTSYVIPYGSFLRASIVLWIAIRYWQLYKSPKEKTSLTWSIWISSWLIVLSLFFKSILGDGGIHLAHSFFLGGIVLLSILIGTRVIQSHGPKDKTLENKKVLYWVTGLIILAMATRVSAYYMPALYMKHLAYSSLVLILAIGIWSYRYLRYLRT